MISIWSIDIRIRRSTSVHDSVNAFFHVRSYSIYTGSFTSMSQNYFDRRGRSCLYRTQMIMIDGIMMIFLITVIWFQRIKQVSIGFFAHLSSANDYIRHDSVFMTKDDSWRINSIKIFVQLNKWHDMVKLRYLLFTSRVTILGSMTTPTNDLHQNMMIRYNPYCIEVRLSSAHHTDRIVYTSYKTSSIWSSSEKQNASSIEKYIILWCVFSVLDGDVVMIGTTIKKRSRSIFSRNR